RLQSHNCSRTSVLPQPSVTVKLSQTSSRSSVSPKTKRLLFHNFSRTSVLPQPSVKLLSLHCKLVSKRR
ncbi:hypothetical protein E3Q19_03175, partial [Wallemia mellicola]